MIKIIPCASSSKGNLYILINNNDYYLIECGIKEKNIRSYLMNYGLLISDFKGCFATHNHTDHILSCEYVNEYMPIYANNQVISKNRLDGIRLQANKPINVGDMSVYPFSVEHGDTDNYAFIFKDNESCVLFATDLMKFTANLSKIKFTQIFIECNYVDYMLQNILENESEEEKFKYIRQCNTHLSLENLKEHLRFMDLSNCKSICLLHASKFLCDKELAIKEIESEFKVKTTFAKEC